MNRNPDEATLRSHAQQAAIFELLKSGTATAGAAEAFRKLTETASRILDVSFVRKMLRNAQDRIIVESTVRLAHHLGLTGVH